MVYRYLTWFCATVLCSFLSHLQQLRNKYRFTHNVTSAAECDLNSPSYLRRHIIWCQFDTHNSISCTHEQSLLHFHIQKSLGKNKSYGATQPASMGDLEAGNLLNTFHFFTSTQKNCVYWDEPTVAKSVMWLRYWISNRWTAVRSPPQAQFISTARRPPSLGLPIFLLNTFTAIVDLSRFNNSCLKSPASTLVDLTFQSRALSL